VFSLETDASRVGLEKLSISQTEPRPVLNCLREQKLTSYGKNVLQNYQFLEGKGEIPKNNSTELSDDLPESKSGHKEIATVLPKSFVQL
jgi:hypothetical protein